MSFSRPRNSCCISHAKGIKIVVIASCVFGAGIILLCIPILTSSDDINTTLYTNNNVGKITTNDDSEIVTPNVSVYIGRKITAFAILQIFSSLCLLNSKRFKPIATVWIIIQTITIIIVLLFLWNLPLTSSSTTTTNLIETRFQRFSTHLFTVLGINVCLTIFLILVLLEFIIHPEKQKQNELGSDSTACIL